MPQYQITTGLPQLPSSGLEPANFQLVQPLYQGLNTLAQKVADASGAVTWTQEELAVRNQLGSLLTQNHRKLYPQAASLLEWGKLVNLYLSGGKITARYADATSNIPAHGVVNEPYGIEASNYGEVILLEGYTKGIGGTVFGSFYFLHNAGNVALSPPAGAPLSQVVGLGLGSAGFYLHIEAQ